MPWADDVRVAKSKVKAVSEFLASEDRVLVCTHATFRFAVEEFGAEAFDDRLIAVDEFHHVSADEDNVLGRQLKELIARDKVHIVAMTGSYFRGDAVPVLSPEDELRFATVTYNYYEQLMAMSTSRRSTSATSFTTDPIWKVWPAFSILIRKRSSTSRMSIPGKARSAERRRKSARSWTRSAPGKGRTRQPDLISCAAATERCPEDC